MAGEVVHHDDISELERGCQDLTDILSKCRAIYRTIDHHRCRELVMPQRGHERCVASAGWILSHPLDQFSGRGSTLAMKSAMTKPPSVGFTVYQGTS